MKKTIDMIFKKKEKIEKNYSELVEAFLNRLNNNEEPKDF